MMKVIAPINSEYSRPLSKWEIDTAISLIKLAKAADGIYFELIKNFGTALAFQILLKDSTLYYFK